MAKLWKCLVVIFIELSVVTAVESETLINHGCFHKHFLSRAFAKDTKSYYNDCFSSCSVHCVKYSYFAISKPTCKCLENLPEGRNDSTCDIKCPDNTNITCGGDTSYSVYNVAAAATTTTTQVSSPTQREATTEENTIAYFERDPYQYYGCYDRSSVEGLDERSTYYNNNSFSECNVYCNQFVIFAISSRKDCKCLRRLPEGVGNYTCNTLCSDNNNKTCGGNATTLFSVYKVAGKTMTSTKALMTTPINSTTTTTTTKPEFSTTTLSDTTTEPPDDEKLKTSHKYIIIGAITLTGVIVVLIIVFCIHVRHSRQNYSSKTNPDPLNSPRNLNNRDEQIDRVDDSDYMYIELGEADIAYTNVNSSQFDTKDDVYDKLNGTHFNFNDPTYHHIGRTNIVGACALADSEYSHVGQCVKPNSKLAVIDSDTYNNVFFNKERGLNENTYMDFNQSTMKNNKTAAIDFDAYNRVYFNEENGVNINVHMTDNDTVVNDSDDYNQSDLNKSQPILQDHIDTSLNNYYDKIQIDR